MVQLLDCLGITEANLRAEQTQSSKDGADILVGAADNTKWTK